jgi:hypothetical protein
VRPGCPHRTDDSFWLKFPNRISFGCSQDHRFLARLSLNITGNHRKQTSITSNRATYDSPGWSLKKLFNRRAPHLCLLLK